MSAINLLLVSVVLVAGLQEILGHGMVMDPVNRSSAWKKGYETPKNGEDNHLNCGGVQVQHDENGSQCGVCGDNYAVKRPRPNENGGTYGTGIIVKSYTSGQQFTATLHIDLNHGGYFDFSVCPLSHPEELETEECFDAHPVLLADGSRFYNLDINVKGDLKIDLVLPDGLTCDHCVFRWHWRTGDRVIICENEGIGCRPDPEEHYRTCSDITIQ